MTKLLYRLPMSQVARGSINLEYWAAGQMVFTGEHNFFKWTSLREKNNSIWSDHPQRQPVNFTSARCLTDKTPSRSASNKHRVRPSVMNVSKRNSARVQPVEVESCTSANLTETCRNVPRLLEWSINLTSHDRGQLGSERRGNWRISQPNNLRLIHLVYLF